MPPDSTHIRPFRQVEAPPPEQRLRWWRQWLERCSISLVEAEGSDWLLAYARRQAEAVLRGGKTAVSAPDGRPPFSSRQLLAMRQQLRARITCSSEGWWLLLECYLLHGASTKPPKHYKRWLAERQMLAVATQHPVDLLERSASRCLRSAIKLALHEERPVGELSLHESAGGEATAPLLEEQLADDHAGPAMQAALLDGARLAARLRAPCWAALAPRERELLAAYAREMPLSHPALLARLGLAKSAANEAARRLGATLRRLVQTELAKLYPGSSLAADELRDLTAEVALHLGKLAKTCVPAPEMAAAPRLMPDKEASASTIGGHH